MKKITIVFGAAMMMALASFAGDGKKDKGGCCSKDKKEACAKDQKEAKVAAAHSKDDKGCCSKGGHKSVSNTEVKKADTKEVKTTAEVKKS